jgi:hypothetical protein
MPPARSKENQAIQLLRRTGVNVMRGSVTIDYRGIGDAVESRLCGRQTGPAVLKVKMPGPNAATGNVPVRVELSLLVTVIVA